MAKISPFQALRYDSQKVPIADVVTQPYDKISPSMQDRYYRASPYNLVRVILGKKDPGDSERNNVYTRAAADLRKWSAESVLVRDPEPSLYRYTQTFRVPGDAAGTLYERRGFIAAGQLEDYDRKIVFRHEQTLSKPKADRLNLLRETQSHFGQIFMLYSDPGQLVDAALKEDRLPDVEVRDEYDVLHRMWRLSDRAIIGKVQAAMEDKKLIIADGHHRYETALNYRNEMRQRSADLPDAPYERVMMTFVNMEAAGLVILPTHRVVFGVEGLDFASTQGKLKKYFAIENLGPPTLVTDATDRLREAGKERTALLAVTGDSAYLLRALPNQQSDSLSGQSPRQRELDVVQLHKLVLEETLGMSEEDVRNQTHLKYVREAQEAVEEVRQGANVAFLMNPVRMDQVRDIAFSGEVLPQKSTDFFPKLLSGLTIYSLEEVPQPAITGGP
jgi:uncharacterized protein (DUF1015 family)